MGYWHKCDIKGTGMFRNYSGNKSYAGIVLSLVGKNLSTVTIKPESLLGESRKYSICSDVYSFSHWKTVYQLNKFKPASFPPKLKRSTCFHISLCKY